MIYLSAIFAEEEMKLETTEMIIVILILQIVGIGGAYFFSWLSKRRGNKISLTCILLIWTFICVFTFFVETKTMLYLAAAAIGVVMGGVQSLSRSTYSKLLPETEDTASWFSFYEKGVTHGGRVDFL